MCGIVGYVSDRELEGGRMTRSLSHRGPDDTGEYSDVVAGRHVFLGHRRLSIIDLSDAGHQPMISEDGRLVLIFNGEIYNHLQLRQRYLADRPFRSQCDTEVLLGLYEKFGRECLRYLSGDFAFCVFDRQKRKLFLARDRLGVKPMYYYDGIGNFAFASEIKAFQAAGLNLELNKDQLQNFFIFKYVPKEETLFRRVRRLPPGCFLEYDLNVQRTRIEKYWHLAKNPLYDGLAKDDAQDILTGLLGDSSRIRLMSDVPVGTYFSGGLDSSAIAYFIRDHADIVHYTARKSDSDLKKEGSSSDFFFASKLAADWGLRMVPIDIGQAETNTGLIRQSIHFGDDLIADGSQIPSFLIAQEAGRKSRVMLSGMGGDELFLGYAGHQISLLASFLDTWPAPISHAIAGVAASLSQGRGLFKPYRRYLNKFGNYFLSPRADRYGAYNLVGNYANSVAVCRSDAPSAHDIFKSYFNTDEDLFGQISRFEFDNFLVKNLHYFDCMCMAHSVEGRVPFLDHRLVEFAFSLPRLFKLSSTGRTKVILKDAMEPFLPKYLIRRRKAAFGMPLRSIFTRREKVNELLHKDFFGDFREFSLTEIDRIIDMHISGKEDTSSLIYALISFQEWHKIFIQGEAVL